MKTIWKIIIWFRKIILYRIIKKTTYGVRVIIINNNQEFLLVKHYYDDFWVLPGGGIKKKEPASSAAEREILEETGIKIEKGNLKKLGEYTNHKKYKKDHVIVFVTKLFQKKSKALKILGKIEIEKTQWFKSGDLPIVSSATQKRIQEFLNSEYSNEIRIW